MDALRNFFFLAVITLGVSQLQGQVPPNDSFANAAVFNGFPASGSASNLNATEEIGEPDHGGYRGGHSVWWMWTATFTGEASLDTSGADFDTVVAVYTGESLSSLSPIASDDDGGVSHTSALIFDAVFGTTYRIAVDGYFQSVGNVTLRLAAPVTVATLSNPVGAGSTSLASYALGGRFTVFSLISSPGFAFANWSENGSIVSTATTFSSVALTNRTLTATFTSVPIPVNDSFARRIILFNTPSSASGTNVGASKEVNEPDHNDVFGGASLWWSWTAPFTGVASFNVNAPNLDPILALYTGNSLGSLAYYASSGGFSSEADAVELATFVTSGTTYQIAVDSSGNRRGPIELQIARGVEIIATADPSDAGFVIGDGAYGIGSTVRAIAFSETAGMAFLNWTEGNVVVSNVPFYPFQASTDRTLVAHFESVAIPANDAFANAFILSGTASGTTRGASRENGEPYDSGENYNSVWWKWTAPSTGKYFTKTTSNFSSQTFVFTGAAVDALDDLDSYSEFTDRENVFIDAVAGTTYSISITSIDGQTGPFSLRIAPAVHVEAVVNPLSAGDAFLDYGNPADVPVGSAVYAYAYNNYSVAGYEFANWTENGTVVNSLFDYLFTATANRSLVANFSSVPIPTNDSFGNAAVLSGSTVTATGTVVGASRENEEPYHDGNYSYRSIWWMWTASASGPATIDLTGSSVEAVLAVYTGETLETLARVAGNSVNNQLTGRRVTFDATAGTTYRIAVDHYRTGTIALGLVGQPVPPPPPPLPAVQYLASVIIKPKTLGTVTGVGTFNTGTIVTLQAKPKKGAVFVNWMEGKKILGKKKVLSFALAKNRTITATFKRR